MDNPGKIDRFIENTAANTATVAYGATVVMLIAGLPLGGSILAGLEGFKLAGPFGAAAGAVVGLVAGVTPCLIVSARSPKTDFGMLETLGVVAQPVENATKKILSPLKMLSGLFAQASSSPEDKKDAPQVSKNLPQPPSV